MENGNNTSAQAEVLLSIRSISKSFDGTLAVDNVNLDIHKGEIFALLGGSGSGKSTLLRMLAGFETPNAGSIMLDGQDVTALPPFLRPTNMMFQSYALFPHMTVEQNIAMGLKQDKLPKSEIRDRVAAMLKLVKMEPYARRKPQQLSGGQQQRVALARSLAKRPKLLLLDEPCSALDPVSSKVVEELIVSLKGRYTLLMVTHNLAQARRIADSVTVCWMQEGCGCVVESNACHLVFEHPSHPITAAYCAGAAG